MSNKDTKGYGPRVWVKIAPHGRWETVRAYALLRPEAQHSEYVPIEEFAAVCRERDMYKSFDSTAAKDFKDLREHCQELQKDIATLEARVKELEKSVENHRLKAWVDDCLKKRGP